MERNDLVPRDYREMIARYSVKSNADVETLRQFMKLQEDFETRQADTHYNDMMSQAQGRMTQISKDLTNPQTRSRYASLPSLDREIRPIYTECGFAISFDEDVAQSTDTSLMLLAYVTNGPITRVFKKRIPVTTAGFRGSQMMTPTHASIAAVTYGRRALLKMIFNLAEDDDDGNLAGGRLPPEEVDPRTGEVRQGWRDRTRVTSPVDPADVDPVTGEIGRRVDNGNKT
jgi:hypothetical protein